MAFSGTVAETTFETRKIVDRAFGRCKLKPQQITSEYLEIANDALYLLLSELANASVPLWCVEKALLPLYEGQGDVTMPAGTVDTLNQNLRTIQAASGSTVTTSTTSTTTFTSSTAIKEVGLLWNAAAAPLAFERSDDGVTWVTVTTVTPEANAGEWTWFDVAPAVGALEFRVRATSGVLGADQIVLANGWIEIPLSRMNRDDWFNLPNRAFTNDQPLQFWFDLQVPNPIMHFWPVPNAAVVGKKHVSLLRHRQIMDVGTLTEELEVPQNWRKFITTQLALDLAREIPEVDPELVPDLKDARDEAKTLAWGQNRDNSPSKWAPDISMYTR